MKRALAILLSIVSIISLSACSKTELAPSTSQKTKQEIKDERQKIDEQKEIEEKQQNTEEEQQKNKEVTTGMDSSQFQKSIELTDKVYEKNQANTMISPLSLNMALGLLNEGAVQNSDSKIALDNFLGTGYSEFAQDYIKNKLPEFNVESSHNGYNTVFEIANSVWLDKSHEISSEYKSSVENKYEATIDTIDKEKPAESADRINSWCSDKTHELINNIVTEDGIENTGNVLVNTVYLESAWSEEWYIPSSEYIDENDKFYNLDGTVTDKTLMRQTFNTFYSNDKATAFGARYMNGMTFIGILPNEEGDFRLQDLNIEELLQNKETDLDVIARMPNLNFETSIELKDILQEFGLEPIFKEETEDFLNICGDTLWVDEVIQKTKLELDEYGTKAAAVTAVMIADSCAMIEPERREENVILNRPFAFVIYDEQSEVLVFVGKITNIE